MLKELDLLCFFTWINTAWIGNEKTSSEPIVYLKKIGFYKIINACLMLYTYSGLQRKDLLSFSWLWNWNWYSTVTRIPVRGKLSRGSTEWWKKKYWCRVTCRAHPNASNVIMVIGVQVSVYMLGFCSVHYALPQKIQIANEIRNSIPTVYIMHHFLISLVFSSFIML